MSVTASTSGLNNNHLKTKNRGTVLRLIANGQCSRTDIAGRMGLTKMAISKIVGELIEDRLLTELPSDASSAVGRTPVLLDISPLAPLSMGVYISRNGVTALICDLKLHIFFSKTLPFKNETPKSFRDKIFTVCDAVFSFYKDRFPGNRLLGIGVSSISPLDPFNGVILNPTNFYVSDFPIGKALKERYNCPVLLDNDMNASALAENLYGVGRERDSFLYLGITNGVGSGAVMNGRLFSGDSITVGEIGHTCINFDGPLCSCGNRGCLELYADMTVILKRLKSASGEERLCPADILRLAAVPSCDEVLCDVMNKLSVALINAVNLLDPKCVIIGHEGAFLPDRYLAMLEEKVNSGILAAQYKTVKVMRSTFFDRAPHLGSACLLFDRLFNGEMK